MKTLVRCIAALGFGCVGLVGGSFISTMLGSHNLWVSLGLMLGFAVVFGIVGWYRPRTSD